MRDIGRVRVRRESGAGWSKEGEGEVGEFSEVRVRKDQTVRVARECGESRGRISRVELWP